MDSRKEERAHMGTFLALVAPSLNFPGFNRASRCGGRKTVKLSMRIVSKSAAVCKCLAAEISLSTTLSLHPTFPEAQGLPVPQLDIARDKGLSYAAVKIPMFANTDWPPRLPMFVIFDTISGL